VLRTTLRWLDEAMPGTLPPRMLAALPDEVAQRAELSAHVRAGGGEIALRQLAGTLDDAPIAGAVGFKRGDPPAYTADLSLDRMALQSWVPRSTPGFAGWQKSLSGIDAELRLTVAQATLGSTAIAGLVVDAAIEAGSITVRQLEGTAAGVRVVASGMLGSDGRLSAGKLSAVTSDATPLADLLPATWRGTPALWLGPARLELQAAGPREAIAVEARLLLADARLEAKPTIDLRSGEWSGALTLRHPGARRLVATLGGTQLPGLRDLPSWLGDGSLALVARVAGGPGRLSAESFDLTAAALHASGDLALDTRNEEPLVSGRIDLDRVVLPQPDGGSTMPLPFRVLRGWRGDVQLGIATLTAGAGPALRDIAATLSVADGALRIERFTGSLGSGTVAGRLVLDAASDPATLSARGDVSGVVITGPLAGTPIDLLSGRANASVELDARGFSPSAILATLGGRVTLSVHDGVATGFDLFRLKLAVEKPDPKSAELAVQDALRSGATGFDRLQLAATIAHGDVTLDAASLTGAAGEARISGGMNLVTQTLDVRIAMQPAVATPPEVTLHLTGPAARPGRTPELAGLARWMAELVH